LTEFTSLYNLSVSFSLVGSTPQLLRTNNTLNYSYQKDKRSKCRNLQTKRSSLGYRGSMGQKDICTLFSWFKS